MHVRHICTHACTYTHWQCEYLCDKLAIVQMLMLSFPYIILQYVNLTTSIPRYHIFVFCWSVYLWLCTPCLIKWFHYSQMVGLYRDPRGENIFITKHESESMHRPGTTIHSSMDLENVEPLRRRIVELENQLTKMVCAWACSSLQ